jgi:hypothetical protein
MQILKRTIALLETLKDPPADPAALGAWWRDLLPAPARGLADGDIFQAAMKIAADLESVVMDLRRDLPEKLLQAEQQIAARLRGDFNAQRRAGLIVTADFDALGRSPAGLILADPAKKPWRDLTPNLFERRWIALGFPRSGPAGLLNAPRAIYVADRARQLTEKLEADRRREHERYAAEQRRLTEAFERDQAARPEARIRQLEAELEELKARLAR